MSAPSTGSPAGHVVEPRQQVDERRLAGAAAADDGQHLPGADVTTRRRASRLGAA
jgi:hypothetical protein